MILLIIGVLLLLVIWIATFRRWQHGIVMLLAYLPFAGAVTIAFYPESYPVLFKDIFFIIPAYIAFWFARRGQPIGEKIPSTVSFAMYSLAALVLLQSFNPNLDNMLVAAIGAKVWLFYLPLIFLAFEFIQTRDDLIRILRLMVVITWVPCIIGILEWISSMSFGYQETMYAIYGEAALGATQNFAVFEIGGDFYRIPSTFTFVAQYFGYTLAMLVPTYALSRLDDSRSWRKFASVTMWLAIFASFMSGARGAYLFVPMLLFFIYGLENGVKGVAKIAPMLVLAFLGALYFAGISPAPLFETMSNLFFRYSSDIAAQGLVDAINLDPLGIGTGMNTGPARYALADPSSMIGIENYYAKAVVELGVVGLLIVAVLFAILIRHGYVIQRKLQDPGLKSTATAILAFTITMVLSSFKGWQIDLDPINVYFWMFVGMMFKLIYLKEPAQCSVKNRVAEQGRKSRQRIRTA